MKVSQKREASLIEKEINKRIEKQDSDNKDVSKKNNVLIPRLPYDIGPISGGQNDNRK